MSGNVTALEGAHVTGKFRDDGLTVALPAGRGRRNTPLLGPPYDPRFSSTVGS